VIVNIFVGNLKYEVTEEELRTEFSAFGQVDSVSIIMDRATGKSKGFGFVEMPNKAEGEAAIKALHLKEIHGRALTVNEARPKTEGGGSRGGFGGGGGYGGGGRSRGRDRW
jgi:RNA recognition motif-containing protein